MSYSGPITMTEEDKQLISGRRRQGENAKWETICGSATGLHKHNLQPHPGLSLEDYQVFSHAPSEYIFHSLI